MLGPATPRRTTLCNVLFLPSAGAIIAVCPVTHDGDDGESDTLDAISEEGGSSSEGSGRNKGSAVKCAHNASESRSPCRPRTLG